MELILVIVLIAVVIAGFLAVYFLLRSRGKTDVDNQALLMLQNQLQEVRRTLDQRLGESTAVLQRQFGESAKIISDITERVTRLDETNKQVIGFAEELKHLQNILQNPKQRGVLGEYYLETLLKNAFQPKDYEMQYKFKDGTIVDAILRVGDKIIPIDSKFSLENYNRITEETDASRRTELEAAFKQDLKKRIDETAKYIRPEEGTVEFSFMFIPAEGIYYDLLVNRVGALKVNTRDLIDYAINEKRVHIVSPTTFYVTLQSMWEGMRAYRIQESTKEILKNIGQLTKHLKAYGDYHSKLGAHLQTAVNVYNNSTKEFGKVDKDILKLTGDEIDVKPVLVAGPEERD